MDDENKLEKEERLLNTAFKLFTEKGIKDTSIQDIVDNANVAKGTFYLYFKDKYEIRDVLIVKKSKKLFQDAIEQLHKNYISNFSDQIIFVINAVLKIYENDNQKESSVYKLFEKGVHDNNLPIKNPEVTLFMIIELASSTCFNSILYKEPLSIEEYKPYLYDTIRKMIDVK